MPHIYLIRHGQASLHGDDYDVLSELGHAQALALGRGMATREPFGAGDSAALDRVVCGPLSRQRDTAARLVQGYRERGGGDVEIEINDAFSEFPAFEIYSHAFPLVLERDASFAALVAREETPQKNVRIFAALVERWVDGAIDLEGTSLETYAAFSIRVQAGFEKLVARSQDERVAVVTSGGPIGVMLGQVLEISGQACMRLCWRVANASVACVQSLGQEATVDEEAKTKSLVVSGMNDISHLESHERTWV